MKKIIVLFLLSFLISACNKSSGKSDDTSFRIQPDTLTKFDSPAPGDLTNGTSYTLNFNGTPHNDEYYAIIYNVNINGTNYVGIALSNDPNPEAPIGTETFNLKIYFQGDTIPLNKPISSDADATIVVYDGVSTYRGITGGPLTLSFAFAPATNPEYSIYTITSSGSINVGVGTLSITSIKALYVGTITQ